MVAGITVNVREIELVGGQVRDIPRRLNAALLILAMFIISRYELSDEVIDKINREIEEKAKA